jgi:hypothetical protein
MLTKSPGQLAANLSLDRLPEPAARVARMGPIEATGTTIAGCNEDRERNITESLAQGDGPVTLSVDARRIFATGTARILDTRALRRIIARDLIFRDLISGA